jgi:hypothetical protein
MGKVHQRMNTSYEVRSGKRLVSLQNAHTAREAVIEYLRSRGCRDDEVTTVGADAATVEGCGVSGSADCPRLTMQPAIG